MRSIYKYIIAGLILSFSNAAQIHAQQTCGFGCLGLSGIYGGYSFQKYDAEVLNYLLESKVSINGFTKDNIKFGDGKGFRIGGNIFRAKFKGIFLSAKGYYQFLRESQNLDVYDNSNLSGVSELYDYNLKINYWGFGVDVGIPLLTFLDLKLLEGGFNFYNIDLIEKISDNDGTREIKYENEKNDTGYYLGTGLIIHVIPDYISIEGTAQFNFFDIDEFNEEGGERTFSSENKSLISNKDITYTVQLNIGLPL